MVYWDNYAFIVLSLAAIGLFTFYVTICIMSHWYECEYEIKPPKRKKTNCEIIKEKEEREFQKLLEKAYKRLSKY